MRAMQITKWDKPLEARDHPDPEPWAGSYVGTLYDLRELHARVLAGKVPPIPIEARPGRWREALCELIGKAARRGLDESSHGRHSGSRSSPLCRSSQSGPIRSEQAIAGR
jgi:hypothetical protein